MLSNSEWYVSVDIDFRSPLMNSNGTQARSKTVRRRALLASAGLATTGGCVRRIQSVVGRNTPRQLSLSIKTLPADADPRATRIARILSQNLQKVGVDATVVPMSREELLRDVLLNQQFDLYVAQYPSHRDAGFLRPLVHSRFDSEPGWQNPFGYSDLDLDAQLERLPTVEGPTRTSVLWEVQRNLVRNQPFSVIAFPSEIRATRRGSFENWSSAGVHSLASYLTVSPVEDAVDTGTGSTATLTPATRLSTPANTSTPVTSTTPTARPATNSGTPTTEPMRTASTGTTAAPSPVMLRATLTDSRPTENLNPLAAEFRGPAGVTSLLYDSLARVVDGRVLPWLASTWEWQDDDGDGSRIAEVTLRDGLRWHDGEPLTAADVAFTYRFLKDTSLGQLSTEVSAPRFRGRSSLVDGVERLDTRRIRFRFTAATRNRAEWVFTVPILPEHVWKQRTAAATIPWLKENATVTEALVWRNPQPIGSGPFRFRSSTVKESVVLDRYPEHFLATDGLSGDLARFEGGPNIDRIRFQAVPSTGAAVELLRQGDADMTASSLLPDDVPTIGKYDGLDLSVRRSRRFYHVGYNVRRAPLSNPRFRRSVIRLLDKSFLNETVFEEYAQPAVSPLSGDEAVPPSLRWNDDDPPLAFEGTSGRLDVAAARERFKEAGYRYVNDRLVGT